MAGNVELYGSVVYSITAIIYLSVTAAVLVSSTIWHRVGSTRLFEDSGRSFCVRFVLAVFKNDFLP
ncbi:hypothetical protein ANAPC1_01431 [Anaplasma phagocytophilum]|uniref:Uncharacterized protein n=1 Tax=Anaplasma phagocytophilum TaxID=948 RepID=A0AA45UU41_ANAPH|nr:hypothetical protein ANAPC1_01431 [Anaplasma phagocytophilum]